MEYDPTLESQILLRNAMRLGVSAKARDEKSLESAIRERLAELGYAESTHCAHCSRRVPELDVCPYCSAPLLGEVIPLGAGDARPHRSEASANDGLLALVRNSLSAGALVQSLVQPLFWLIVLLAATPVVLKFFGLTEKWMFVYFSFFWAYIFFKVAKVRPGLWKASLAAYIFTAVFALPLLIAWISMPPHVTEALVADGNPLARLVGFVFGVGIREEVTKVLAVLWLTLFRVDGKPVIRNAREALLVGSIAGLGFAAVENMDYLDRFQFMDKVHYTFGMYSDNLSFRGSMSRVMLTPFVHAVWAGVFSYFLYLGLQHKGRARKLLLFLGLAIAAPLHGFYNLFSSVAGGEMLVIVVIGLSFAIWLACLERASSV
jgi:RsiW-degrading membrane proteinase PrsW (M82 family)